MERVLADLVVRADRDRFETHVLCLGYLGRYAEGLERVAELHLAKRSSRFSMLRPHALAEQMRRIAPDVVHTHSGVWHKGTLAARLAGVRWTIHTEHGRAKPDPLQNRLVDGLAARRTDRVVAVSALLAEELPRTLRISSHKVVHVANGVDTDLYCPRPDTGALRRELGLAPDAPIIGSIGRLEPIKGYDVMIDAFARLLQIPSTREAVLVVAGHGSTRASLQSRIDALGLTSKVHLLGWRNDTADLHAAFSLFTMSSRSEGTSISLLEAMSAGLAPVVTDVGGNAAVLGSRLTTPCLVPSEAPDALAARWADLLADTPLREWVGARSRARVVESFGVDAMVRAYEALYDARPAARGPALLDSRDVLGVPPSPRASAECPPTM